MPGPLQHSPEDVLRQLLVDKGWANDPDDTTTTDWQAFASGEPDLPDNCITLYGTDGVDQGRNHATGERAELHGFQLRVRSKTHPVGAAKIRTIAVGFDEDVYDATVYVDGISYLVHSVKRTGNPLFIGNDAPNSKRKVFTLNCTVTLRQTDEIAGDALLQESLGFLLLE